jgi:hypothetical protein
MYAAQLGKLLRESYEGAEKNEKVTMIHLFGIKYYEEIKKSNITEIIAESGIYSTYRTELGKGLKLAKYVKLK